MRSLSSPPDRADDTNLLRVQFSALSPSNRDAATLAEARRMYRRLAACTSGIASNPGSGDKIELAWRQLEQVEQIVRSLEASRPDLPAGWAKKMLTAGDTAAPRMQSPEPERFGDAAAELESTDATTTLDVFPETAPIPAAAAPLHVQDSFSGEALTRHRSSSVNATIATRLYHDKSSAIDSDAARKEKSASQAAWFKDDKLSHADIRSMRRNSITSESGNVARAGTFSDADATPEADVDSGYHSDEEWERERQREEAAREVATQLGDTTAVSLHSSDARSWCPVCPPLARCTSRSWRLRRRSLFEMLESPSSSTLAMLWFVVTMSLILISLVSLVLETEPNLQDRSVWATIEAVCVYFFTVEYLFRLLSTPRKVLSFVFDAFNVLDVVSIAPYYVFLVVGETSRVQTLFRAFRVARTFRVFRLSHYVSWFRLFANAIYESGVPLILMLGVLFSGSVFFSAILYYVERGHFDDAQQLWINAAGARSDFQSIPAALWFVLISVTTVGYGDVVPITIAGKVLSGAMCICGVLILSIPVSVVSQNFANEFESFDRSKEIGRMRLKNLAGPATHAEVAARAHRREVTVADPGALTALQLRMLETKHHELLMADVDRLLDGDAAWLAGFERILRRDRDIMFKQMRGLLIRQMNGEMWRL
jgi:hypothetical protein